MNDRGAFLDCAAVRAALVASPPLEADAMAHLATCCACQMTQAAWSNVRQAVRAARVVASPGLAARTRLRVRTRAAALRQRRFAWALLATTVTASVGLTLAALRISWALAGLVAALHYAPSRLAIFTGLNLFPVVLVVLVAWTFGVWPSVETPEKYYE